MLTVHKERIKKKSVFAVQFWRPIVCCTTLCQKNPPLKSARKMSLSNRPEKSPSQIGQKMSLSNRPEKSPSQIGLRLPPPLPLSHHLSLTSSLLSLVVNNWHLSFVSHLLFLTSRLPSLVCHLNSWELAF